MRVYSIFQDIDMMKSMSVLFSLTFLFPCTTGLAAFNRANYVEFTKSQSPGLEGQSRQIEEDPEAVRALLVKGLRAQKLFPDDNAALQKSADQLLSFWRLYFGYIYSNRILTDEDKRLLGSLLNDESLSSSSMERSVAGILLYIEDNDKDAMDKALVISPHNLGLFALLKDREFADLMASLLSQSASELVQYKMAGSGTIVPPHLRILREAFPEAVRAVYFQQLSPECRAMVLGQFGPLHGVHGTFAFRGSEIVNELRSNDKDATADMISTIAKSGFTDDLRTIFQEQPNLREVVIVQIKTQSEALAKQLKLLEAATRKE
jgi:hypothetical protein